MYTHIHKRITEKALRPILKAEALKTVTRANLLHDIHVLTSEYHFDNCRFKAGIRYIEAQYSLAVSQANRDSRKALKAFGRVIHTVQDFYAHSNWIELNGPVSVC